MSFKNTKQCMFGQDCCPCKGALRRHIGYKNKFNKIIWYYLTLLYYIMPIMPILPIMHIMPIMPVHPSVCPTDYCERSEPASRIPAHNTGHRPAHNTGHTPAHNTGHIPAHKTGHRPHRRRAIDPHRRHAIDLKYNDVKWCWAIFTVFECFC